MESYKEKMKEKVNNSKYNIFKSIKSKRYRYRIQEIITRKGEIRYFIQYRGLDFIDFLMGYYYFDRHGYRTLQSAKEEIEALMLKDERIYQDQIISKRIIK